MRALLIGLAAFMGAAPAVASEPHAGIVLYHGSCNAKSHVAEGRLGGDLSKAHAPIACETVAAGTRDDGFVLISFLDGRAHSTPLGFSGERIASMPGSALSRLAVTSVFLPGLTSADHAEVTKGVEGWCFWKTADGLSHLTGVSCVARVDRQGRRTVYNATVDDLHDPFQTAP